MSDSTYDSQGNVVSLDSTFTSDTGTSAYNADQPLSADTGAVFNVSSNPVTSSGAVPDAGGGNGSYPGQLQNVLTQGLSDALVSATEFGIGSLTDRLFINANARAQAASAPASHPNQVTFGGRISVGWLIVGALAVFLLVKGTK